MATEDGRTSIPSLAAQRSYEEGSTVDQQGSEVSGAGRWAFANFANMVYGYGELIPSCTQEEVLQVCCPEFNVGMLHFGTLGDEQVVVVRNVRRTSDYTGYMASFKMKPLTDPLAPLAEEGAPPRVGDILTMDAVMRAHYDTPNQLRDINKAELAFGGARGPEQSVEQSVGGTEQYRVSSGRWGCGIFGGYVPHKVVQQALAAHLSGTKVYVSRYTSRRFSEGEELMRAETAKALEAMEGKDAAAIWAALQVAETAGAVSGSYNPDFVEIFVGKLSNASDAYEHSY